MKSSNKKFIWNQFNVKLSWNVCINGSYRFIVSNIENVLYLNSTKCQNIDTVEIYGKFRVMTERTCLIYAIMSKIYVCFYKS